MRYPTGFLGYWKQLPHCHSHSNTGTPDSKFQCYLPGCHSLLGHWHFFFCWSSPNELITGSPGFFDFVRHATRHSKAKHELQHSEGQKISTGDMFSCRASCGMDQMDHISRWSQWNGFRLQYRHGNAFIMLDCRYRFI